jgi:hypothetical protein
MTVVDLPGCVQVDGFGELDKLTLEQVWSLIHSCWCRPGQGVRPVDARARTHV